MTGIDHPTMTRFVELAAERLHGDWVVVGGAVLPLLGVERRPTLDIDVACLQDADQAQVVELLQIASDLGLPVESINQAAAWFLRDIPGWRDDLVVVRSGAEATIHVPTTTLYLLSKIPRLTTADLDDCRAMLEIAVERDDPVDAARVIAAIDRALADAPSPRRAERLRALREAVERSS